MSMNGKWKSIFEMICVSIIYRVRIISTANISGRFIVSDTLSPLNAYQIVNDISVMSDRYIYICIVVCTNLPQLCALTIRQIYYGDHRDNTHSVKIEHPISRPSSSDDTFSLMVSPLSALSPSDNQFCHIVYPYLMIVNSS